MNRANSIVLLLLLFLCTGVVALGQGEPQTPPAATPEPAAAAAPAPDLATQVADLTAKAAGSKVVLDTVWTLITAFLVFWMNAGFALVESGMCRVKNAVNILSKNFIVFALSSLAFFVVGWGLMFGNGNSFIGTRGALVHSVARITVLPQGMPTWASYSAINWTGIPLYAKFFFQLVFAGTAATIVSGCVAERIKYLSFILFSVLLVGIAYPITGHWIWGGGWLATDGFLGFRGFDCRSHGRRRGGVGGILMLGPRIGKYKADGSVNAIPGHNMTSATLGCLILWLGWFGFNPGSTMAADPGAISHILLTTNMAGAMGLLTATATAWIVLGKPDLGMTINGCLAGLVAITAPCAFVSVSSSLIIGGAAGIIVVVGGALLRQGEDRRSCRRSCRSSGQRRLRNDLRRPLRAGQDHGRRDRQRPLLWRRFHAACCSDHRVGSVILFTLVVSFDLLGRNQGDTRPARQPRRRD